MFLALRSPTWLALATVRGLSENKNRNLRRQVAVSHQSAGPTAHPSPIAPSRHLDGPMGVGGKDRERSQEICETRGGGVRSCVRNGSVGLKRAAEAEMVSLETDFWVCIPVPVQSLCPRPRNGTEERALMTPVTREPPRPGPAPSSAHAGPPPALLAPPPPSLHSAGAPASPCLSVPGMGAVGPGAMGGRGGRAPSPSLPAPSDITSVEDGAGGQWPRLGAV